MVHSVLRMQGVIFIIGLLLIGCVSTNKEDYSSNTLNDLNQLYEIAGEKVRAREYIDASRYLIPCAQQGHGGCAEMLGWLYYEGSIVPSELNTNSSISETEKKIDANLAEGLRWLTLASNTNWNFGYAGLSGALSVAEIYCKESSLEKTNEETKQMLSKATYLFYALKTDQSKEQSIKFKEHNEIVENRMLTLLNKLENDGCL